ncbi:hypothetical protein L9W80_18555 [Vibrio aestuarianus]|uniref:hypothetical protein n=1 Tax=Vibrio aestuarianus TaxID=28171 RepID=UPI00237CF940|nr:hypothetical protein [Vibrio aestuarianus]MDE1352139.1 hypothetical protein [Vibrio aestuarianus]
MSVSLTKFCDTKHIRFSYESMQALERIDNRVGLGNLLVKTVGISPLVEIFLNPKSAVQISQDIYEYHWDEFGQALNSIPDMLRLRVWEEATNMAMGTSGEEREFWKCVIQASR